MGKLIDGVWHDVWYDTEATGGAFVRKDSSFRGWVTPEGSPGPNGEPGFPAEAGRYHLYVSLACPWAHRALIFRKLKGLEALIPISVVHPHMGKQGWSFEAGPGVIADSVNGARYLHELYQRADPHFTGRVTVPVLWDKKRAQIVNNESSEIIRIFNSAFDGLGAKAGDYAPNALLPEIDEVNARIYESVNNGVYKCGFATTQAAYEEAYEALFDTLDWLEARLSTQRYLVGAQITEADWRLFTTLLRFDSVYVGHFKTNKRRLVDYPNLWAATRELYQIPGIAETVNMQHIKQHYYGSHPSINPSGVVPLGPELDFSAPHHRD